MNKQELVDAVAAATAQSKVTAAETVDAFIGTVTKAVMKGTPFRWSASARF